VAGFPGTAQLTPPPRPTPKILPRPIAINDRQLVALAQRVLRPRVQVREDAPALPVGQRDHETESHHHRRD
jgi:hypothetical protein